MKLWRRLSALVVVATVGCWFGVASVGCGAAEANACDEALDKAEQCGIQNAQLTPSGDACEAIAQCQARCVMSSDCGTIRDAVEGLQNSLLECVDHCG
jgi:hypothetical protein